MGYALGIDVGTTFTGAAVMRDGRAEIVPLGNHAATIPTLVFLRDDDSVLTGDAAERRGLTEPARLAREFKRRFGDTAPIMLDRTPFSADRLFALMLRQIMADITERQGGTPDVVAVTHPANWGEFKLDLMRQAVQSAGVHQAVYLTEPVAAALQYAAGERVEPGEALAVYDLGGGTFDAAVLRKTATGFELLGRPQGIERLGGIDFDEAVLTHVRRVVGDAIAHLDANDPPTRAALARLRQECVLAKETLSADSDATVPVLLPNLQTQVRITRVEFEDMIRPILRETIESLQRAVESSGVPTAQLKAVLLAGGSSRIPLVADMVRAEIGRPVVSDTHPKHAVALGAARFAAASKAVTFAAPPAPAAPTTPPSPPAAPVAPPAAVAPPAPPPTAPAPAPPAPAPTVPVAAVEAEVLPTDTPAPAPRRSKRPPWIWAAVAAVVVALVVVAVVVVGGGDDNPSAASTTVATSGSTGDTTATTGGATSSVPAGAEAQLAAMIVDDRPVADSLVGTYVPQLSAKYIGLQFEGVTYGPDEILTDHQTLRDAFDAILVDGGYYQFENADQPMNGWYLTLVPQPFASKDQANQWCSDHGLDSSKCFGRLFMPPTSAAENKSCSTTSGACVGIEAAVWANGTLYVSYLVTGFDPNNSGQSGDFHVHFFFSTVQPDQAGAPGSGPWFVWDRADGGGELVFTGFTQANLTEYGYQDGSSVCIAQANHDHSLTDAGTFYCFPVPNPGQ